MPAVAVCSSPGCPALVEGKGRCPRHRRNSWRTHDHGAAHARMARQVKREEPACRRCAAPTAVADHIVPRAERGGDDRANYQGLCQPCSDAKTRAESKRGAKRAAARRRAIP